MTYRLVAGKDMLPAAEWLAKKNYPVPNPALSVAWVAENEDGVQGVLVLASQPMIESIRVEEKFQTEARVGIELFRMAEEWIKNSPAKRVWMHTGHPTMKRMLRKIGANKHPDELFLWERPCTATTSLESDSDDSQ